MGSAMGSRLMLWEAVFTMNYGLNSVGSMTICSQEVILLCPVHQGLCSLCHTGYLIFRVST